MTEGGRKAPAASDAWREELASLVGGAVELDAPLAPKVAFRVGGPAEALVKPRSSEDLARALRVARRAGVPVTVLGTGSNVLVSDLGIRGLVVRLAGELSDIHLGLASGGRGEIEAGAGALNARLVALALNVGLVDIEFLATIPGTLGGALIMNAGAHGGEIGKLVRSVTLIDEALEVVERPVEACGFAYRRSGFRGGEVLTKAVLAVPRGDAISARRHLEEMRARRRATQPIGLPNAGSIFKNPPGDHAGRLIEACGLKGRRLGAAQISELHANFVVNLGGARAKDVLDLAEEARAAVRSRFGIDLEWEVKRLGDWGEDFKKPTEDLV